MSVTVQLAPDGRGTFQPVSFAEPQAAAPFTAQPLPQTGGQLAPIPQSSAPARYSPPYAPPQARYSPPIRIDPKPIPSPAAKPNFEPRSAPATPRQPFSGRVRAGDFSGRIPSPATQGNPFRGRVAPNAFGESAGSRALGGLGSALDAARALGDLAGETAQTAGQLSDYANAGGNQSRYQALRRARAQRGDALDDIEQPGQPRDPFRFDPENDPRLQRPLPDFYNPQNSPQNLSTGHKL